MRTESCRSCGGDLQELQSCSSCKKGIQHTCNKCRKNGEIQVHLKCILKENAIAN